MQFAIAESAPGRLEIREGGGGLTAFGLPFVAAGIFALLTGRAEGLIGALFIVVGAIIAFGRHVTALDLGQQVADEQWRVFIPIRSRIYQLSDYGAVTIALQRDADSADQYPVALKGRSGGSLVLCRPTEYAKARECAAVVAQHLGLDIEDTSTGHTIQVAASDADAPLQTRLRGSRPEQAPASRPPAMRSEVADVDGGIRIVMPMPRVHPLVVVGALFPAAVAMMMLVWVGFFSRPRSLAPAEWIFLGILFLGFAVLPVSTAINRWLRSRIGRTIVTASREGLRIEERGTLRTRRVAEFGASEILDVDQGKGIVVKTRKGLTTFGAGLADDEIRYLHAVIRRALAPGF